MKEILGNNLEQFFFCTRLSKRIGVLVSADRWSPNRRIKDKTLEEYVKEATEKVICNAIDKNIKDIFAKKVAEML